MRRGVILFMLLAVAAGASRAQAHAGLQSAEPAPGSAVAASPAFIRLTFSEPVEPGSTFAVYAADFQPVPGLIPVLDGATLRAAVPAPLPPGTYTVQWTALSGDGGKTEGSYQFRVREPGVPVWAWALVLGSGLIATGAYVWRRRTAARLAA